MNFNLLALVSRPAVALSLILSIASTLVATVATRDHAGAAQKPCVQIAATPLPRSFDPAGLEGQDQINADCISWQTFIGLNWPVAANAPCEPDLSAKPTDFGKPNGYTTVWESYPVASTLFSAHPSVCTPSATDGSQIKVLRSISKFGNSVIDFHGIPKEAFTSWLTDQAGGLTYFEIHVNKDEAQYIQSNGLATSAGQLKCASGKGGLTLPQGAFDVDCDGRPAKYGDQVGAIEIKAAWIVLEPSDYSRFLTAKAKIYPPNGGAPRVATVGLVGLHLVHKMRGAEHMVWATFEHVDNAPDAPGNSPMPSATSYTYFNPKCNPAIDYYGCVLNKQPPQSAPFTAPVQVGRLYPIGPKAQALNKMVHDMLAQQAPTSVFRYYQLVDSMWPTAKFSPIVPGSRIVLPVNNMKSETGAMANTTLETYLQRPSTRAAASGSATCLHCHAFASILSPSQPMVRGPNGRPVRVIRIFDTLPKKPPRSRPVPMPTPPPFASDYSFIFGSKGDS